MKVDVNVQNLDRTSCLRVGRDLFKIECGFAFATFIMGPTREATKNAKVASSDIIAGLSTAATAARMFSNTWHDLDKPAKKVASAMDRLKREIAAGPKSIPAAKLPELEARIGKARAAIDKLAKAAETACSARLSRGRS